MKQRNIEMGESRPVMTVDDDSWPSIADAQGSECWIRVRMHEDGRCLVYGACGLEAVGEICAPEVPLAEVVAKVGTQLELPASVVDQCVSQLDPERPDDEPDDDLDDEEAWSF